MGILSVIATLLCLAGIGFGVVALATTSWINPGVGLFQTCVTFITQRCDITIGDDIIVMVVACLICIGLFLSIPAVLLLFVDILRTNKRKVLAAGALLVIAGILIAAGSTTYTVLRKPNNFAAALGLEDFGYSYYMSWGSCGSIFLAGIFAFAASAAAK
ncbi:uncharacterized protein LOC120329098 [Styela clava]|uniref:uncharacterized protein LOC120329098 n=1 Tax=Styela clava TaxID=7725 RepID=UPI001939874A|nr:uncharacterized protein LOC120329098 [Styela clava]XP_039251655.1 uncharacterized protein LOC120329098 [Styela clava]XP_039251656.1 uncharacterized protein LOC120329098 [Styela clava]XP_039251657.1 uncharacterized protein LOC120329098 [Styela clava]XP_039251658.1 uncharacterized protein LOC120329098 [Styela clava]